jgi:tetratricopeptide (TPR) repeat protein
VPAQVDPAVAAQVPAGIALMFPGYLAFLWPWVRHTPAVTLQVASAHPVVVAGAALLQVGFVALVAWLVVRRLALAVPLAAFGLTLLPTLLVNLSTGVLFFSERFFYLPSAMLAWAFGVAIAALPDRRAVRGGAIALAVLLVLASGVRAHGLLPAWRSDATLFESMARLAPGNYMARTQWARMLVNEGREEEARRELEAADRLEPRRADAPSVRALLHYRRGEWPQALDRAEQSIARGSIQMEPWILRAASLMSLGRMEEARRVLEAMRARAPRNVDVGSLWGQYLLASGRHAEALPLLESAVVAHPTDADVAYALGLARVAVGSKREAGQAFRHVTAIQPRHYDAWLQIAMLDAEAGDLAGARAAATRALALPEARDGRAAALAAALAGEPR